MKLGLLTAILSNYTFEQTVDYAARVGYQCLEVACWPNEKATRRYAGVCHIDVENLTEEKIAKIKECCDEKNIKISALGYYPNPLSPDKEQSKKSIQHIKNLIDAACILGISNVNTFIGRNKDKSISENMTMFERIWPDIIKYAEENRIYIGIENCPMYFSEDEWPGGNNLAISPDIWKQIFSLIQSKYFGLNYDPSHLYLQGMDYIKPLYEFKDKIFHVHLKDIRINKEKLDRCGIFSYPLTYMEPKTPGLGEIDWGAFVSALYDIGYSGAACVEIEDKAFEKNQDNILSAISLGYRYMHQFIG